MESQPALHGQHCQIPKGLVPSHCAQDKTQEKGHSFAQRRSRTGGGRQKQIRGRGRRTLTINKKRTNSYYVILITTTKPSNETLQAKHITQFLNLFFNCYKDFNEVHKVYFFSFPLFLLSILKFFERRKNNFLVFLFIKIYKYPYFIIIAITNLLSIIN